MEAKQYGDFIVDESGVYYRDHNRDEDIPVSSVIYPVRTCRSVSGGDWSKEWFFLDPSGAPKTLLVRNADVGPKATKAFLAAGVTLGHHASSKRLFEAFLRTAHPGGVPATSSHKPGWVRNSFLLPDASFGSDELVFSGHQNTAFSTAGSLPEWKESVGRYCVGNSRLVFSASMALAAPLLHVVGEQSGGFLFRGDSSTGKSTAVKVAMSALGSPDYKLEFDATKGSLEEAAEAHNDCLLVLDEIGQVDSAIVGNAIYMLGNEQSKGRMRDQKKRWRTIYVTSGEVSLAEHMAVAKVETKMGQEIRLLEINAVANPANPTLGVFESLHEFPSPEKFAKYLSAATSRFYGQPLRAFLAWLVGNQEAARQQFEVVFDSLQRHVPPNAPGQVQRALRRFALVGTAGELATDLSITGWRAGEATNASGVCFQSWLEHFNSIDPKSKAVNQVRTFVVAHERRFQLPGERPVANRIGWRKGDAYLFEPDVFEKTVCGRLDPDDVLFALEQRGLLNTSGNDRRKKRERIAGVNGGPIWVYSISTRILDENTENNGNNGQDAGNRAE